MIEALAYGAFRSFVLFLTCFSIGLAIGAPIALLAFYRPVVRPFVVLSSALLTAIPLLAVLFWMHYPLQMMLAVVWPPVASSIVVLSIFVAVNFANIGLTAALGVHRNYAEVVTVLAIPDRAYFQSVLLPTAARSALPQVLTLAISTIHLTMFASLIGVEELFRVTQRLNAQYLKPVELYTAMALAYALICAPLYLVASRVRTRLSQTGYDVA